MSYNNVDPNDFEAYEEQFNPLRTDRQARRKRKPKVNHKPKKTAYDILTELADSGAAENSFETTYQPSKYEGGWLLESLADFYRQEYITDVLAQIRGGKEASVYRCAARPATGATLLAAKVYRPQKFRSLSNDAMYREGRAILNADGNEVKETDHRVMRAIGKKSAFGEQVSHTSWLMHEYTTLARLHDLGAAVPKPFAAGENAILMGYVGDENIAAPILNEVELEPDEAVSLFREVLRNIELMLQNDLIHGDLSAYNILYWEGAITLIDFPQVTKSRSNSNSRFILARDVQRVCEYFDSQGVSCDADAITDKLWRRYVAKSARDQAADESRLQPEEE